MRTPSWSLTAGLSLMLLLAPAAFAADSPDAAVVSNGVLTLGVTANAGLAVGGSNAAADLVVDAGSAPSLSLGADATQASVEPFAYSDVAATSSVVFADPGSGGSVRVVQQVHPLADTPNMYEVPVTVENLGDAPLDVTYTRPLLWAPSPGELFQLSIGSLGPHEVQTFRLYFAVGSSLADATAGFAAQGATQLSQFAGETTFVFGYAPGAAPVAATAGGRGGAGGAGGGGGGAGIGGGGGGGGNGGKAAGATRGMTVTLVSPSPASPLTSNPAPAASGGHPSQVQLPSGPTTGQGSTPNLPNLDEPSFGLGNTPPVFTPQATPELDSLTLMSVGGLVGAGLTWLRARRRRG